jgi:radical SAM protein with 4Fe4S-binding SPASM domain
MWHSAVMTWDGTIVPCCFDKDAQYKMGNILETDFAAIWQGEKYNSFRKKLLQERENIDICKNCSEGLNVFEK